MKLWEKPLATIYEAMARPYMEAFILKSPETILTRSLEVLDIRIVEEIRTYVEDAQDRSGGFIDKAGKPDLYYSLFGFFLAEALDMKMALSSLSTWLDSEIRLKEPEGVHLNCSAILYAKLGTDQILQRKIRAKVRRNLSARLRKQPAYSAFLNLLTCYYTQDYRGLHNILKQVSNREKTSGNPSSVLAARLVLRQSFKEPVDGLISDICTFYDSKGGFRATRSTAVPDLLSTAVALYALDFAGADLRMIKPDCLAFIDRLYHEGGFAAHVLDGDTDIEYTFYGLLALGALAE